MRRVIGIDFGTSTTYMNVKRYNGDQPDGDTFSYMPVVFNYGESSGYVATIVRENGDGSFDFGEKAAEPLEGARIYTEIKMRLESADEEQRMEARRITKAFFRFLHDTYVQQAGNLGGTGDEEETVVSYPVKWQEETAQFMLEAAREAGFQHVSGMDEAEAAVAAVVSQSGDGRGVIYGEKPGYLLLIDMGAGTTDLVVCRYWTEEKGLATEMVANWPQDAREPTFGGREIDTVLEQYIEAYLERALNPALAPQAHVIAAAPGQAKMWKERNVSVTLGAGKEVNTCAYIGTYRTMGMLSGEFPAFGREKFETFLEDGLKEYVGLVKGCLDEAARRDEAFVSEGLDLVILTGGHSAWYFAREILTGAMEGWLDHPALAAVRENPYRVISLPNPQSTVALGLVYSRLPVIMDLPGGKKAVLPPQPERAERPAKSECPAEEWLGENQGYTPPSEKVLTTDHRFVAYKTRGRYALVPVWDPARCIQCSLCAMVCPNDAVRAYALTDQEAEGAPAAAQIVPIKTGKGRGIYQYALALAPLDCTGCFACIRSCLPRALSTAALSDQMFQQEVFDFMARRVVDKPEMIDSTIKGRQFAHRPLRPEAPENWTAGAESPRKEYRWDDRLTEHISAFVQDYDRIYIESITGKSNGQNMRRHLRVGMAENVLFAHDDTLLYSGKNGFLFTESGIYCREMWSEPIFTPWGQFLNATLTSEGMGMRVFCSDPLLERRQIAYVTGDLRSNTLLFLENLQEHLRREARRLEEGAQ